MAEEFRFGYPVFVILQTAAIDDRGMYGAILRPKHPETGELMFPIFTDVDLANRAGSASKLSGVSSRSVDSPIALANLVEQFIENGGKHVAIDPIADGRSWWNTIDAEGFLGDLRKSIE